MFYWAQELKYADVEGKVLDVDEGRDVIAAVVTKGKALTSNTEVGKGFDVDGAEIYLTAEALTKSLHDRLTDELFDGARPEKEETDSEEEQKNKDARDGEPPLEGNATGLRYVKSFAEKKMDAL